MRLKGPLLFLLALVLLLISLALDLAGFSTTYWMTCDPPRDVHLHYGLWTVCSAITCRTIDSWIRSAPGGMISVQFSTGHHKTSANYRQSLGDCDSSETLSLCVSRLLYMGCINCDETKWKYLNLGLIDCRPIKILYKSS